MCAKCRTTTPLNALLSAVWLQPGERLDLDQAGLAVGCNRTVSSSCTERI